MTAGSLQPLQLETKLPRKRRVPWMESRLRRLRFVKEPSQRQKERIRQLETAIRAIEELRKQKKNGRP